MNSVTEILRKVGIFYIATVDEKGEARVRPFGAVAEIDGETYICTGNTKHVYRQMMAHNKVEISGMCNEDEWIRLNAEVERVDSDEARAAFLEQCPQLKIMYSVGDGYFEVLKLNNAQGMKYSLGGAPVEI